MNFEPNLVSIITPVYNASRYIEETIQSVMNQTYQQWEWILVDDASEDESVALCQKYAELDQRIRIIELESNQGAAVARNKGLSHAIGQYVAFIDSDDVWFPTKLERQLAFMDENDYDFTYTNLSRISIEGEIIQASTKIPASLNYHQLLKNTAIACSTVVIDRNAVGDFRMPNVRRGQDTATWLMLMRERNVIAYGLNEVLNLYRKVPGSISSNRMTALKRTWNVYRNVEKLPLLSATYYFVHYVINALIRRL